MCPNTNKKTNNLSLTFIEFAFIGMTIFNQHNFILKPYIYTHLLNKLQHSWKFSCKMTVTGTVFKTRTYCCEKQTSWWRRTSIAKTVVYSQDVWKCAFHSYHIFHIKTTMIKNTARKHLKVVTIHKYKYSLSVHSIFSCVQLSIRIYVFMWPSFLTLNI